MVEEIPKEQTLDSEKKEAEKTEDTAKEQVAKTFTEDDLNRIVKERLDRERKKYANHADLEAKAKRLDEIENAKKSDEEKALAKLKALEETIAEKEKAILKAEIKEKKRQAIETAKLSLPKDITPTDLLDMIPGESDEDIEAAILKFKKMFPESKSQGTGTQIADTPGSGKKTIDDEMVEVQAKLKDAALSTHDKELLARKLLSLGNQKMLNY